MAYTGLSRGQQAGLYYARRNRIARLIAQKLPVWSVGLNISAAGQYVQNAGLVYRSLGTGTTGSTPPTQGQGQQSDGAVTWQLVDMRSLLQFLYTPVPTP